MNEVEDGNKNNPFYNGIGWNAKENKTRFNNGKW